MSGLAISLVLTSTFLHAGWNLLARGGGHEGAFFRRMLLVIAAAGCLPAVAAEFLLDGLPRTAWYCVAGSGVSCGLYYIFLARAYASSDFTVAYPVARALPVLLVAAGDVLRGRPPGAAGWLGMVLVALGCMLCPLRSFRDISLRRYWRRTSLWLLLTAGATVGYTLFDKVASEAVTHGPDTAARYGYFFFLVALAVYVAASAVLKPARAHPGPPGWRLPALGAVLCFTAYWLVLWAYQMARHAGYIVAFRQFSIAIGVVLGFWIFKEHGRAVRLAGTATMIAGLTLIALCGS